MEHWCQNNKLGLVWPQNIPRWQRWKCPQAMGTVKGNVTTTSLMRAVRVNQKSTEARRQQWAQRCWRALQGGRELHVFVGFSSLDLGPNGAKDPIQITKSPKARKRKQICEVNIQRCGEHIIFRVFKAKTIASWGWWCNKGRIKSLTWLWHHLIYQVSWQRIQN